MVSFHKKNPSEKNNICPWQGNAWLGDLDDWCGPEIEGRTKEKTKQAALR